MAEDSNGQNYGERINADALRNLLEERSKLYADIARREAQQNEVMHRMFFQEPSSSSVESPSESPDVPDEPHSPV